MVCLMAYCSFMLGAFVAVALGISSPAILSLGTIGNAFGRAAHLCLAFLPEGCYSSWLSTTFSTCVGTVFTYFMCRTGVYSFRKVKLAMTVTAIAHTVFLFMQRFIICGAFLFFVQKSYLRLIELVNERKEDLLSAVNEDKKQTESAKVGKTLRSAAVLFQWLGYTHALLCSHMDLPSVVKDNGAMTMLLNTFSGVVKGMSNDSRVPSDKKASSHFRAGARTVHHDYSETQGEDWEVPTSSARPNFSESVKVPHYFRSSEGSEICALCGNDHDSNLHIFFQPIEEDEEISYLSKFKTMLFGPRKESEGITPFVWWRPSTWFPSAPVPKQNIFESFWDNPRKNRSDYFAQEIVNVDYVYVDGFKTFSLYDAASLFRAVREAVYLQVNNLIYYFQNNTKMLKGVVATLLVSVVALIVYFNLDHFKKILDFIPIDVKAFASNFETFIKVTEGKKPRRTPRNFDGKLYHPYDPELRKRRKVLEDSFSSDPTYSEDDEVLTEKYEKRFPMPKAHRKKGKGKDPVDSDEEYYSDEYYEDYLPVGSDYTYFREKSDREREKSDRSRTHLAKQHGDKSYGKLFTQDWDKIDEMLRTVADSVKAVAENQKKENEILSKKIEAIAMVKNDKVEMKSQKASPKVKEVCSCGKPKQPGMKVCPKCHQLKTKESLPNPEQVVPVVEQSPAAKTTEALHKEAIDFNNITHPHPQRIARLRSMNTVVGYALPCEVEGKTGFLINRHYYADYNVFDICYQRDGKEAILETSRASFMPIWSELELDIVFVPCPLQVGKFFKLDFTHKPTSYPMLSMFRERVGVWSVTVGKVQETLDRDDQVVIHNNTVKGDCGSYYFKDSAIPLGLHCATYGDERGNCFVPFDARTLAQLKKCQALARC